MEFVLFSTVRGVIGLVRRTRFGGSDDCHLLREEKGCNGTDLEIVVRMKDVENGARSGRGTE